ncbi:MAG: DUF92 domain-containing protein [Candidatus Diapherotrites archaeon]|nr:DUF92 domain-containing protein [Candidatus Diapherotrites archaeon]
MDFGLQVMLILAILLIFSVISFKKKLLDFEGVLVANIVGILIFWRGNIEYFFLAVLFFAVAEAGTTIAQEKKYKKHETRTTGNIFGNAGPAVAALLFGFPTGFFAGLAVALADTFSSEIGLLSKRKPLLITTLEKVPHGTDGGVTPLGMYASLAGAAIIAAPHFFLFNNVFLFFAIMLSGFFGCIVDSFFGAVFEREKKMNNTEVNLLGTAAGVLLCFALTAI